MDELVSLLADKASCDLPVQVEALAKAQREHAAATVELQNTLVKLEDELKRATDDNKLLVSRKNKLITRMCVCETERDETKLSVDYLENELSKVIDENESLKIQIRQREADEVETERMFKEYSKKIEDYKKSLVDFEHNWPEIQELEVTRKKLDSLREDRDAIRNKLESVSGSSVEHWRKTVNDLQKDVQETESDLQKMTEQLEEKKYKLADRQKEKRKLETANMILKKRNSALMIRLKRQAESQRQKYEQLSDHIQETSNKLASSRARLQQLTEQ